jgi:glycine/D-amino acid oxidase-like deaminating enzyme
MELEAVPRHTELEAVPRHTSFLKWTGPRRIGRQISTIPADDSTSWVATVPPRPPAPQLRDEQRADCAVIGAGLTGIAIARRLVELRPEWRVLLLDAQRVGSGASGRSSGFVVDLTDFAAKMKPLARDRYVALARYGIDQLRDLVKKYEIECAWDEKGWLRAAAGQRGMQALENLPPLYKELGISYQPLDRQAMAAVTGSSFYQAGMRLPGYPLVHTASLVHGLADALSPEVDLYEDSAVQAIERTSGSGFKLTAGSGAVLADRVFLATNGYTPALGFLSSRIFPLYTFGSLTRPLTADEQAALGGELEWGILAMDPMGSTVRRTADQRILIRNTIHYSKSLTVDERQRRKVVQNHRKALSARFPELNDLDFEFTWNGLMGSAHNCQLSFGELEKNLFVTGGYSAAGLAMSQTAGKLLADFSTGQESNLLRDMISLPPPTWMPPEPFRSLGGGFLAARMDAQAGDHL